MVRGLGSRGQGPGAMTPPPWKYLPARGRGAPRPPGAGGPEGSLAGAPGLSIQPPCCSGTLGEDSLCLSYTGFSSVRAAFCFLRGLRGCLVHLLFSRCFLCTLRPPLSHVQKKSLPTIPTGHGAAERDLGFPGGSRQSLNPSDRRGWEAGNAQLSFNQQETPPSLLSCLLGQ